MSTVRFGGVRFRVYPQDHERRRVHALIGDGHVIVELTLDRRVVIARRNNAIRNAKTSELTRLWESMQ